jgi:hypothetical protein
MPMASMFWPGVQESEESPESDESSESNQSNQSNESTRPWACPSERDLASPQGITI